MNIYSDDILVDIVENASLEDAEHIVDRFYNDARTMFCYFSYRTVNPGYTAHLFSNIENKMAFYVMNPVEICDFHVTDCPCGLVYREVLEMSGVNTYYILMICTRPRFKNMGYASMLLNGFIDRVRNDNTQSRIVLSSIETAVTFYEHYGFKWKRNESIRDHPVLLECESPDQEYPGFILELVLHP